MSEGPPFRFESATGPLAAGYAFLFVGALLAGMAIVAEGLVLALVVFVVAARRVTEERFFWGWYAFCAALVVPMFLGHYLFERGRRRLIELVADDSGITLSPAQGGREHVAWSRLREVVFRRLEVRFATVAEPGKPRGRFVLTVDWSRAEDLVRLKNYMAGRMGS